MKVFFYCLGLSLILSGCSSNSAENSAPPEFVPTQKPVEGPARITAWPSTFTIDGTTLTFYEPQIRDWQDHKHVTAWLALSVIRKGAGKAIYGALQLEADTSVDMQKRSVWLYKIQVTDIRFPELSAQESKKLITFVKRKLKRIRKPVNLDLMLASLADSTSITAVPGIKVDPPEIFYSAQPAILLQVSGNPILSPINGVENLEFAVNTNWDLFRHKREGKYYLLNRASWMVADDLKSAWKYTAELPEEFSQLPKDQWKDTFDKIPAKTPEAPLPKVYVGFKPSELIVSDGKPKLELIEGTNVSYVTNTQNDLFSTNGNWYYLVSGRWFRSSGLNGPWEYASDKLPEGFARIPLSHAKSSVLSAVPGTVEAQLAVLQSQIPTKAEISRSAKVEVAYAGSPKFEKIDGTNLQYAVNTNYDVITYDNNFYVCYEGVWFGSQSANGPFIVAASIPSEIYLIPISHPLYHVTFVTIYEHTEQTVTTGYTSGYHHHHVHYGVVVWGTGWYYPPYYYYYGGYPYYYYPPYSYGISAVYNPTTGAYARRGVVYGPYGGYGRSYGYNPTTGTYVRGQSIWDGDSAYGMGQAYNSRTNTSVWTEQAVNGYERWGETVVRRGDEWATVSKYGNERGTKRDIETSKGGSGTVISNNDNRAAIGRNEAGDIYAGKDGTVFRKNEDGWQKREGGEWAEIDQGEIDKARSIVDKNSSRVRESLNAAGVTKEEIQSRERKFGNTNESLSRKRQSDRSRSNSYQQLNRDYRSRQSSRQGGWQNGRQGGQLRARRR